MSYKLKIYCIYIFSLQKKFSVFSLYLDLTVIFALHNSRGTIYLIFYVTGAAIAVQSGSVSEIDMIAPIL